MIKPIKGFWK
uniref:Uncharacterized protein n=1 Tax=Rhizophora mucronata TaxID=61149 RepID=A0A2P2N8D8_RHIMU